MPRARSRSKAIDSERLVAGLKSRGHRSATVVHEFDELATILAGECRPGDLVVCLGAGDITRWAAGLAEAIEGHRQA